MSKGSPIPYEERYFENFKPGSVFEFSETVGVSEEEIISFAEKYDPQFFHTDPKAAEDSNFRGLIASGAHTISLTFWLVVRNAVSGKTSCGSPGIDEVRWLKPLRPGDTLRVRLTILDAVPSSSKKDRGSVKIFVETVNQKEEVVMTYKGISIFLKRLPG
ncbi:MAG: MaoC family dehydratase [Desulfovibrio sp.]|jgi:acyl dehydratase|nr:MaoC family dehydratase [Desulfovibrio sp.]